MNRQVNRKTEKQENRRVREKWCLFFRALVTRHLSLVTLLICIVSGQFTTEAQSVANRDIFRAMNDELKRNMDSLSIPGWEKPFFIQYVVREGTLFQVQATLGALTGVTETPVNNLSVHALTGDYQSANINLSNTDYYSHALRDQAPADKNYREIRRRLWLLTDNAYKKAIEEYSNKITSVKQMNLDPDALGLPDFIPLSATRYTGPSGEITYQKDRWERIARDCSAVFKKYPQIYGSNVGIEIYSGNIYSVNSEGTSLQHPSQLVVVAVNAFTKAEDGEEISDRLTYYGWTEADIPVDQLTGDITAMADQMMELLRAPKLEESYTGPLMLEGAALGSGLTSELLASRTGLVAYRVPLKSGSVQKLMEDRIGRKILPSDISVKSLPHMKSYNGQTLIGSYEVDSEGVTPLKELLLVENGMLRALMCDRVPTLKIKQPTGNRVYTYQPQNISTRVSPGVLSVTSSNGLSYDELKNRLLSAAREEGLDYAYIARKQSHGRYTYLYKVMVADGSEQLVRAGVISGIKLGDFKRALGTSSGTMVLDMIAGGVPVSVIYPEAMLLEEIEIEKANLQNTTKLPVVDNPLVIFD